MTFDQIEQEVMDRLNLTSTDARARIGRSINERYRWVTSSIGLQTATRTVVTGTAVIANQYITFTGITKVLAVYDNTVTPPRFLHEGTIDDVRQNRSSAEPVRTYAVYRMGASTVTILLDCLATTAFVLTADGYTLAPLLIGTVIPAFNEDYHDILIYGAMATELKKMEKPQLAVDAELTYQSRIADLRMFIAKSAYLDIAQGLRGGRSRSPYMV